MPASVRLPVLTMPVPAHIVVRTDSKFLASQEGAVLQAGEGGMPLVPPNPAPPASNILTARIQINEWRVIGLGSGFLVAICCDPRRLGDPRGLPDS